MPRRSVGKWERFRELYEHHYVGMEMIAVLGEVQLLTVQREAVREGWREPVHTVNRMRFRLSQDILEHLKFLNDPKVDEALEEKRAKWMHLTAKTLESMELVERKLWLRDEETEMGDHLKDWNTEADDPIPVDDRTVDKITADLERFVRKVESHRGDAGAC